MRERKTRHDFFTNILSERPLPEGLNENTIRSWRMRYKRDQLSLDKIREILTIFGYTRKEREIWKKEGKTVHL